MAKTKDGTKKSQVWLSTLKGHISSRLYGYIHRELDLWSQGISDYNSVGLSREYRALEESFINSALCEYNDIYLHHISR